MAIDIKTTASIQVTFPVKATPAGHFPKPADLLLALQQLDQEFHLDKVQVIDIHDGENDLGDRAEVWVLEVSE